MYIYIYIYTYIYNIYIYIYIYILLDNFIYISFTEVYRQALDSKEFKATKKLKTVGCITPTMEHYPQIPALICLLTTAMDNI